MIKMIFSDFDETMLNYYTTDKSFDDYKIEVLKRLDDKGIDFCVVTGRSLPFFNQFPNFLGVVDYIMSSNGACIYEVKNNKFIYQSIISEDAFDNIVNYTITNNGAFLLNVGDKRFRYGEWDDNDCLEYDSTSKYSCEQIILSFPYERLQEVIEFLGQFKDIVVNNIGRSNAKCLIDVNNKDVSKGNAALYLCNYLGIDTDDVMAFGDGMNDRTLFEAINKGIAMGNAIDKLKVLSKDVALSCEENGMFKYIEDNLL